MNEIMLDDLMVMVEHYTRYNCEDHVKDEISSARNFTKDWRAHTYKIEWDRKHPTVKTSVWCRSSWSY